jgi:transmembrane sensor
MSRDRISYLFSRHYEKTASPRELAELMDLIRSGKYNDQLKNCIHEVIVKEKGDYKLSDQAAEEVLSNILQKGIDPDSHLTRPFDPSIEKLLSVNKPNYRISWIPKLAAASAIVLASFIGFNLWNKHSGKQEMQISETKPNVDLLPGKDKAYLSLSDGTSVNLESYETEPLLRQLGMSNDHNKGELTYRTNRAATGYNTLSTPFGGQYKLVLPDGSKAWLNAGSTLKFPNTFENGKRRVEMSGEVYFEIASDPANPFIVTVKSMADHKETEVRVLGTHFNISSYSDEPQIKTTLLEGSVEIKREGILKTLHPGQQARIQQRSKEPGISIENVKVSSTIAWKEGRFEFNDNIKDIMRQIARWYDVKILYEGTVGDKSFAGAIPRKKNVSEVLKMLELTGGIRFTIDDRTIIVRAISI